MIKLLKKKNKYLEQNKMSQNEKLRQLESKLQEMKNKNTEMRKEIECLKKTKLTP